MTTKALEAAARALAKRTLEYVGEETISEDDFLDCDREMQKLAREVLAALAAIRPEDGK